MSAVPPAWLHIASVANGGVGAPRTWGAGFFGNCGAENFARSACAGASMRRAWGGSQCGGRLLHGANDGCQWQAGHAAMQAPVASVSGGACRMHGAEDSLLPGPCMVRGARGGLARGSCTVHGAGATRRAGPCIMQMAGASLADDPCMVQEASASSKTGSFSAIYEVCA
jgi:hypothetical protein